MIGSENCSWDAKPRVVGLNPTGRAILFHSATALVILIDVRMERLCCVRNAESMSKENQRVGMYAGAVIKSSSIQIASTARSNFFVETLHVQADIAQSLASQGM